MQGTQQMLVAERNDAKGKDKFDLLNIKRWKIRIDNERHI